MKKIWITICLAVTSLLALFSLAACGADYSEIAGTYELQDITGTINNVTLKTNMYSYYRIILTKDGKVTIQSKRSSVDAEEGEKKGTFTYSAEKERLYITTKSGTNTVTEEYTCTEGVIIYKVEENNKNYTITFAIENDKG
ncbi:MAG: hypothetical protein K2L02_04125 [Clostridia bacterium]|nr:hypothetical protein [Clostridia bacterium]